MVCVLVRESVLCVWVRDVCVRACVCVLVCSCAWLPAPVLVDDCVRVRVRAGWSVRECLSACVCARPVRTPV